MSADMSNTTAPTAPKPLDLAQFEGHTPGQWKAEPFRLKVNGQEGPVMSYLVGDRSQPEGMKVSIASERVADHHLCAAAPSLLAECKRLRAENERLRKMVSALNASLNAMDAKQRAEIAALREALEALTSEVLDDISECNGKGVDGYVSIYARVTDARAALAKAQQ